MSHDPGLFELLGLVAVSVAWGIFLGSFIYEQRSERRERRAAKWRDAFFRENIRAERAVSKSYHLSARVLELEEEIERLRAQMQAPLGAGYREPDGDYAIPKTLTHSNATLIQGGTQEWM